MEKRSLTIWAMVAVIFAVAGGSAGAVDCNSHIWIDQATGINHPDTNGTPDEPFKSITYALSRADYLGWPEPWHIHIGPGVYDANSAKPGPEWEIFPIELRQDMIFESGDPNDPNGGSIDPEGCIIDGQHLVEGFASLLHGNDLTGLEIRSLTFRNMYHNGNGGAVQLINCAGKIENCIIENCSARYGGGVWLSPPSTPTLFNFTTCTFTGNAATNGNGGAIYVSGTLNGNISECIFTSNSATKAGDNQDGFGGGFCVSGTLTGNISRCSFAGNSVHQYGKYGDAFGGGFYVSGTLEGNITGCSFTDNSALADGCYVYPSGGGFCVSGTLTGDISACSFTGNSVAVVKYPGWYQSYGGGFYVGTLNGSITGCNFRDNSAEAGYGGLFYVNSALNGNISGCEFFQNYSTNSIVNLRLHNVFGGKIENCIFSGHEGIAVWLGSNSDTMATIRSCLFVAPVTLGEASGWAVRTKQKTTISNNTMVGPGLDPNYSPSAVYIEFGTQAENGEIFNNIIVETKRAIHVNAGLDMPITYNQFYNVDEIVCQGEQCLGNDIWWLEQLLNNFRHDDYGDPLFFAYDPTYHIRPTSPCVDSGDPNYVMEPNETDIDGQPRVAGLGIDRGADEYLTYLLSADLYHDGIVNFFDFAVLGNQWRQPPADPNADIAPPGGDGIVDYLDLEVLVEEWLQTEPWY